MPFLPIAERHEGVNLEPDSHAGTLRRELNQQVPGRTEAVVALNDVGVLTSNAQTAAQPGINTALLRTNEVSKGGTVPDIPVSCEFKWFTTP